MAKVKSKTNWVEMFLTVQPIVLAFLAVFIFRSEIEVFWGLSILMLVDMALIFKYAKVDKTKIFPYILIALAIIGLSASVILSFEKMELLKNPEHVTSCSFSPVVACSPVIASAQASAIDHLPNPFFGIFGFACLLTAGMSMLAGATKLSKIYWRTLFAGISFGVLFCIWLINAGVYEIGALCLYCFSVWLVTFSLFWLVLAELLSNKMLSFGKSVDEFIIKNKAMLITINIGIVILLLYFRWSDYWNSLF